MMKMLLSVLGLIITCIGGTSAWYSYQINKREEPLSYKIHPLTSRLNIINTKTGIIQKKSQKVNIVINQSNQPINPTVDILQLDIDIKSKLRTGKVNRAFLCFSTCMDQHMQIRPLMLKHGRITNTKNSYQFDVNFNDMQYNFLLYNRLLNVGCLNICLICIGEMGNAFYDFAILFPQEKKDIYYYHDLIENTSSDIMNTPILINCLKDKNGIKDAHAEAMNIQRQFLNLIKDLKRYDIIR